MDQLDLFHSPDRNFSHQPRPAATPPARAAGVRRGLSPGEHEAALAVVVHGAQLLADHHRRHPEVVARLRTARAALLAALAVAPGAENDA
jgi:hypothetical protein